MGPGSGRGPKGAAHKGPAAVAPSGKAAVSNETKPQGGRAGGAGAAAPQRRPAGTFSRLAEPRGAQQAARNPKSECLPRSAHRVPQACAVKVRRKFGR